MIKTVYVDTFEKALGRGQSIPNIIVADDGNEYVLKTQKRFVDGNIVVDNMMFFNELLAYQIGLHLQIPMPASAIAILEEETIDNDPTIRFARRFEAGQHFSSEYIDDFEENYVENLQLQMSMGKKYLKRSWNNFFGGIVNPEDVAKIIAFDILIANFDRYTNTGNLQVSNNDNRRKVYAIDHGHALFGPAWGIDKQRYLLMPTHDPSYVEWFVHQVRMINQGLPNGLGDVFRAMEKHIDLESSNHSFKEIVFNIEQITESQVMGWLENIPNEWYVDMETQKAYVISFLMQQKLLVREIIQVMSNLGAFSNTLGGKIEWKEDVQADTV